MRGGVRRVAPGEAHNNTMNLTATSLRSAAAGYRARWADQPDNDGMGSAALTAFRLVQHAQMVHSGVFSVLWEW